MARLGPFENYPRIAVAVSGGADSLALALLVQAWVQARGGAVLALTVDHRLRPSSGAEARQVVGWLARHGIACRRLAWDRAAGRPGSALQAAAREARYRLLAEACRRRGILHLALAHHAGDQAETVLMRLARGGVLDGLAGMPAEASREGVRLIRPLLGLPPARLKAGLRAVGQAWIEDPSNSDEAFERVRWRRLIPPAMAPEIASAAAEIAEARLRHERAVGEFLAEARLDPAGFLSLGLAAIRAAEPEIARRALGRALMVVGGEPYSPRRDSLARLLAEIRDGLKGRTLGGCRLVVKAGRLLVFREVAAAREEIRVESGERLRWDNRFAVVVPRAGLLARLGEDGWALLPQARRPAQLPREAALTLPCLWRRGRPAELPCLGPGKAGFSARFRPRQPLVPACFTVANWNVNII